MFYIYVAEEKDIDELNRIAYESEAYWGYDPEFMEKFKIIYRITEDYIRTNPTFVLAKGNCIIGFYSLLINDEEIELEFFYILPRYIGKGYGKKMWEHLIGYCKEVGIKSFCFVTSPQAKGFYEKMGAVKIDEVESLIRKERKIPKLKFEIMN